MVTHARARISDRVGCRNPEQSAPLLAAAGAPVVRAAADVSALRLSRLLRSAAPAGQRPAQRVCQGGRVARLAPSAGRARTTKAAPDPAPGRSRVPRGARPPATAAPAPRPGGEAADAPALASGACAPRVDAAPACSGPSAD